MFINPNKFLSFSVQKNRVHNYPTYFVVGNNKVDTGLPVKLLLINIDNQVNFNQQISNICKSVSILVRLTEAVVQRYSVKHL